MNKLEKDRQIDLLKETLKKIENHAQANYLWDDPARFEIFNILESDLSVFDKITAIRNTCDPFFDRSHINTLIIIENDYQAINKEHSNG